MKPLVGIVSNFRAHDGTHFHRVRDEYIRAVEDGADAAAIIIPATGDAVALLPRLDGLLLPGAVSNVAPWRYDGPAARPGTMQDEARDAAVLAIIPAAIKAGLPLLAICRGFQELNVALGGTLHQHVHEIPGRLDHREDFDLPTDDQYAHAHSVALSGLLETIAGRKEAMVNSLHHQGIDRLAPGLRIDATAPDGQAEAVSLPDAPGFVLGVQWHPEWRWSEDPLSCDIFRAFGAALRRQGSAFTPS